MANISDCVYENLFEIENRKIYLTQRTYKLLFLLLANDTPPSRKRTYQEALVAATEDDHSVTLSSSLSLL